MKIAEAIWESIDFDSTSEIGQIPQWQIDEINKRLNEWESGEKKTYTWQEVKAFAKEGL